MYKIGIIGHEPDRWGAEEHVRAAVHKTIDLLTYQYADVDTEMVFHISGNIGVGHVALEYCVSAGTKYHLHLPASVDNTAEHWFGAQKEDLVRYFNHASGITIANCSNAGSSVEDSYKNIVDASGMLVCFWRHIRQGHTANAIKYAFGKDKLVLSGLEDLRLITKKDFIKNP